MARYYAKTPRVLSEDIYRFIARNTSLTISQVKEVFDCYEDLIKEVVKSKGRTNDLIIQLPKVGHFYFIKKKGRKKGSVVKLPDPKQDYVKYLQIKRKKLNLFKEL